MNDELSAILKRYNLTREDLRENDSAECQCGEHKILCAGRKLAQQRGIDPDADVKAFSDCILAARSMDDSFFGEMSCFYFGDTSWGER